MRFFTLFFLGIFPLIVHSQEESKSDVTFVSFAYTYGKTAAANYNFPEVKPLQGIILNIGKSHFQKSGWAKELGYPKTGISLSYTNFGNKTSLGYAISAMPFLELGLFKKNTNDLNLQIGLGGSYFNKQNDATENVYNKAISTEFTWAFRSMLYYDFLSTNAFDFKLGLGYYHNSNGHVRLPNQGLNSFLVSISSQHNMPRKTKQKSSISDDYSFPYFFETRLGLGQRVLSLDDNNKKEVYTFAASLGKNYRNFFHYGVGMTYRFYEDYYDYIQNNGALVNEMYPEFKEKPIWNASNIAFFVLGELLMGHVGIEMNLGVNIHKPFYKVDWKINEGKYQNGEYQLGELTSYYKMKHTISSRLGLKYYFLNTSQCPQNNFYVGAHINANLGQADFSELSFGYVYSFK